MNAALLRSPRLRVLACSEPDPRLSPAARLDGRLTDLRRLQSASAAPSACSVDPHLVSLGGLQSCWRGNVCRARRNVHASRAIRSGAHPRGRRAEGDEGDEGGGGTATLGSRQPIGDAQSAEWSAGEEGPLMRARPASAGRARLRRQARLQRERTAREALLSGPRAAQWSSFAGSASARGCPVWGSTALQAAVPGDWLADAGLHGPVEAPRRRRVTGRDGGVQLSRQTPSLASLQ